MCGHLGASDEGTEGMGETKARRLLTRSLAQPIRSEPLAGRPGRTELARKSTEEVKLEQENVPTLAVPSQSHITNGDSSESLPTPTYAPQPGATPEHRSLGSSNAAFVIHVPSLNPETQS